MEYLREITPIPALFAQSFLKLVNKVPVPCQEGSLKIALVQHLVYSIIQNKPTYRVMDIQGLVDMGGQEIVISRSGSRSKIRG